MTNIIQAESTLTDRYQTTIPDIVRKTLGLGKRDKIRYIINNDGTVVIARSEESNSDPIIEKFLQFIALDLEQNPQSLQTISSSTINRLQSLVDDVEIDLDAALIDEEE